MRAGRGGGGAVSFHRASYLPKGGPDGGDGGRGGDVVLCASAQLATLEDITLHRVYRAENGRPGQGGRRSGRAGRDLVIELPVGTLVWNMEEGRLLADLTESDQRFIVVRGGSGGRGNARFATPRNRAPRRSEPGGPSEERRIKLELKLIADVGLVGRPNAGKSTLLAALSRAHPRVADYPFSTLSPALGIVPVGIYQRFVLADIPGLAEGARFGRGLGHRFLRHIERTRLIVLLIEAPGTDYRSDFEKLHAELEGFSPELLQRPRLIVMSKADLPREGDCGEPFPFDLEVSALTGDGLKELVDLIADRLGLVREAAC